MNKTIRIIAIIFSTLIVLGTLWYFYANKAQDKSIEIFTLRSIAFKDGEAIPRKYTCDGQNISPELTWSGAPAKTKSFALIVDDPNAARFNDGRTFYHWAMFNIPSDVTFLARGHTFSYPHLSNDYDHKRYDGPCPPKGSGVHNYHFTLYALDQDIPLMHTHSADRLKKYLDNTAHAKAELIGTYER